MEKIDLIWQVGTAIGGTILVLIGGLIGWGGKKLIEALWAAVVAVTELKVEIKLLYERTDKIPRMENDINELHKKTRSHASQLLDLKGED